MEKFLATLSLPGLHGRYSINNIDLIYGNPAQGTRASAATGTLVLKPTLCLFCFHSPRLLGEWKQNWQILL